MLKDHRLSRATAKRLPAVLLITLLAGSLFAQQGAAHAAQHHASVHPPASSTAQRPAHGGAKADARAHSAPLSPEEQAAQVLNRFTFGPRPGEVDEVAHLGWESWFEQQLNPASIPDPILEKRLAQYPALALSPQQLALQFPDGQVIRRIAEGKLAMPADPQLAGVYEVLLARYQRKQAEDKAATGALVEAASPPPVNPSVDPPIQSPKPAASLAQATKDAEKQEQKQRDQAQARMLADQILGNPKNLRLQAIFRLPVDQRITLTGNLAEPEKSLLLHDLSPHERELFEVMGAGYGGNGVVANDLQQAKILRAVLSERQLEAVMSDFWFNHFNIDLGKSGDEIDYAPSYEREAIRAHALGKFRDLLLATAEHPAMLLYLDNWLSMGPDSAAAGRAKPAQQRGLNENYGREVMELHTVGVDGGYTQADVTSLAKILTGWTINQPQLGGGFLYDPRKHEPGPKLWFGQQIGSKAGEDGLSEGVQALSWLAAQPQTAHLVCYKLAQRFVADTPAAALVDRMAAAYLSSDGDIRSVLRAMVHSPEFFDRANYRNKVKVPLEFVASSLRATSTDPANPGAIVNQLRTMGEPLFRCLPPTGYSATGEHWMNSGALLDRLNYALQLTSGRMGGMHFDAPRLLAAGLLSRPGGLSSGPEGLGHAAAAPRAVLLRSRQEAPSGQQQALLLMEELLVPAPLSEQTNRVIRQQFDSLRASPLRDERGPATRPAAATLDGAWKPGDLTAVAAPLRDPTETLDMLAAMILGSPEFQVH